MAELNIQDSAVRNSVLISFLTSPQYPIGERVGIYDAMMGSDLFPEFKPLYNGEDFYSSSFLQSHGTLPYPVTDGISIELRDIRAFYKVELQFRQKRHLSQKIMSLVQDADSMHLKELQQELSDASTTFRTSEKTTKKVDGRKAYEDSLNMPLGIKTGVKALDDVIRGLMYGTMTTVFGYVSHGKCLSEETLVYTVDGCFSLKEMSSREGQLVLSEGGVKSVNHQYDKGVMDGLIVKTGRGYKICGSRDHRVRVLEDSFDVVWKKLSEVQEGDILLMSRGRRLWGKSVALPPVELVIKPGYEERALRSKAPCVLTNEMAYALGLLMGDGTVTKSGIAFDSADHELVLKYHHIMAETFPELRFNIKEIRGGYWRVRNNTKFFRSYINGWGMEGSSRTKEIPLIIRKAPESCVVAFIRGWFDTDGYAGSKTGQTEICSASVKAVEQLHVMLLNLGVVGRIVIGKYAQRIVLDSEATGQFRSLVGFGLRRKEKVLGDKVAVDSRVIPFGHKIAKMFGIKPRSR